MYSQNENLYDILNISNKASAQDIKSSYRKLAREFHPDKCSGNKQKEEHFKKINTAYETLSNQQKKNNMICIILYHLILQRLQCLI